MKKRIWMMVLALCCFFAMTLPASAENVGVVTPAEHDDIMGVLFDGAPYMTIDASQTVVKFQVPQELRGVGALQVYDYRHGIKTMLNNVDDVTPDADGYVEIVLPSTGEFCIAKVPFTDAFRLTLDLRYLDSSMWESAKTPDEPFDTDVYIIPPGDWRDSKSWREQQGLDPWPVVEEAPPEEPEEEPEEIPEEEPEAAPIPQQPEQPALPEEPEGDDPQFFEGEEEEDPEPQFPDPLEELPFPWGSYVVVIFSFALGVMIVYMLVSRRRK